VGIAAGCLASVFSSLRRFIPGITGRLYQQFGHDPSPFSVMLSAFNALTLSPGALAGLLLRPKPREEGTLQAPGGPLGKFFDVFNRYWERSTNGFCPLGPHAVIHKGRAPCWCCWQSSVLGRVFFFGSRLPSSFMPDEDQGYIYVSMQLPHRGFQWNAQARACENR